LILIDPFQGPFQYPSNQIDQQRLPPPHHLNPSPHPPPHAQPPVSSTCADIMIKYNEEFQNTQGYVKPVKCHAGYHAGMGDLVGLKWHLGYDRKVNENYNFSNISDKLVLITAKFCGRKNIYAIFKCLKEFEADFKVTERKTEQTTFHLLYFNLALCNKITYNKDKLNMYHKISHRVIKFLKKMGCNINAKDKSGRTILSYYLEEKFLHQEKGPIIKSLLKNGADPNIPVTLNWNFDAKTALFQVVKNKWPSTALELIVRYGVDVKAINKDGLNALAVATQDRNLNTMAWMLENINRVNESDSIKIAKKFAGNFSKEAQLLNKRRNKVIPTSLPNHYTSSSESSSSADNDKDSSDDD